ncbi:MAG: hypothetical protein HY648_11565 [Acidobacteria bacterium]|nr:hypothetical protein [Acidobacteriota bacterium]
MNRRKVRILFPAAMVAFFIPFGMVQAQQKTLASRIPFSVGTGLNSTPERRTAEPNKRVWSNDDFPARESETAPGEPEQGPVVAVAPEKAVASAADSSPEVEQAQREVAEEMLATARNRQKSYDDTIGLVEARLQTETSEFRKEVYQKILADTKNLKQINDQMLKRFESMSGAAEQPADSKQ